MNTNLTQYVYLHYQPQEYYKKYLKEIKKRSDGRQAKDHRTIRINISPNTVIINAGQTTILANLSISIQPVLYSPITKSYGKQLIKINVHPHNMNNPNRYERNASRSIEQFINRHFLGNCRQGQKVQGQQVTLMQELEKQLIFEIQHDNGKKQLMAFMINVDIQTVGNDGGLPQYSLLATQILMWCATFHLPEKLKLMVKDKDKFNKMLVINTFIFPIRYCQILDEILIDPCQSQCSSSNFEMTIMKNLLNAKEKPTIIEYAHKGESPSLYVQVLQKLYETQMSKLALNIKQIQQKVYKGQKYQNITIDGI